ncbi:MAG: PaaI family thioesterase [Desulfobacterales bacterium]|nr:PaaI family thioesterase [Desulfobacterales bacterium]
MEVSYRDNKAFSRLVLKREFQGWKGIVHGGVVATILDEIMAHAVTHYVGRAVTTSLQITYRAPLHVGDEFEAIGYVVEQKSRAAVAKAEILVPHNKKLIARGESKFILLK